MIVLYQNPSYNECVIKNCTALQNLVSVAVLIDV